MSEQRSNPPPDAAAGGGRTPAQAESLVRRVRSGDRLWQALASADVAAARLAGDRRIVALTPAMQRLLDTGSVLTRSGGRIVGASSELDAMLRRLAETSSGAVGERDATGTDGTPFRLTAVVHARAHPFAPDRDVTMLVRRRSGERAGTELLRERFGLTPAECRCALALPRLGDVPALAREFGVGRETIRTQLRSVFAKTGVGGQAELVLLLARERLIDEVR
jgi:DNA-binding CsgD family transcriptional regulator